MSPLAEMAKGLTGNPSLTHIDRDNIELDSLDELVELAPSRVTITRFHDHGGFQE